MKSREQWILEQEAYLQAYDRIRQELLRYPDVVEVGVGVRQKDGRLTEEMAFQAFVNEKIPENQLRPEQVLPKMIEGFRVDVQKRHDQVKVIGFNDEDDWKNYSTKVGGIRIGSENSGGTGTLGCFCRKTSDNSVVMLSNHHVLFSGEAKVGSKVGQPEHSKSLCCVCNEIGEVIDGEAGALDCAIAKLNSDVPFFSKVRQIKKGDGTLELNGFLSGSGAAVASEEVWKVGARTGLTRGTITTLVPDLVITPKAPFPRVANRGDSGSVVVSLASSNVVGLLKSIDAATETLGFATPIASVLARLGITVIPTNPAGDFDVLDFEEEDTDYIERFAPQSAFADATNRLQTTANGKKLLQLLQTHQQECLHLIQTKRAVTVPWHRHQGPTFLTALARSAREPSYRIPDELNGVQREQAARQIFAALQRHGSPALREDLQIYSEQFIAAFAACDTVEELFQASEAISYQIPTPILG